MKTIKITGALIAIYVLAALLGVFDIDDSAIRDVQRHGYSDVVIISRHYMFISLRGCGKFDTVRYDMAAVNALGLAWTPYTRHSFPFCLTIETYGKTCR